MSGYNSDLTTAEALEVANAVIVILKGAAYADSQLPVGERVALSLPPVGRSSRTAGPMGDTPDGRAAARGDLPVES